MAYWEIGGGGVKDCASRQVQTQVRSSVWVIYLIDEKYSELCTTGTLKSQVNIWYLINAEKPQHKIYDILLIALGSCGVDILLNPKHGLGYSILTFNF
jgi:hypothetical protein